MNIILLLAAIAAFFVGYFIKDKKVPERKNDGNEELKQAQERYKKIKKSFNELMDYDYDTALGSGKYE